MNHLPLFSSLHPPLALVYADKCRRFSLDLSVESPSQPYSTMSTDSTVIGKRYFFNPKEAGYVEGNSIVSGCDGIRRIPGWLPVDDWSNNRRVRG
jgi:hypothetical protein